MKTKFIFIFVVVLGLLIPNVAQGEISVGVKRGDWIEYSVITTGRPPQQFDVTWARMQILNVKGPIIVTNVTTRAANGTVSSLQMTLNLEKGEVGAWFIIPANLKPGDSFLDASNGQHVVIQGEQQLTYAGNTRAITNATTTVRIKQWDESTGIFVKCIDVFDNYTINATAIRTNMWGNQNSLAPNIFIPVFSVFTFGTIAVATGIGMFYLKIKKKEVNSTKQLTNYSFSPQNLN